MARPASGVGKLGRPKSCSRKSSLGGSAGLLAMRRAACREEESESERPGDSKSSKDHLPEDRQRECVSV